MKREFVEVSNGARIFQFFEVVDKEFYPPLSERVNLPAYANKLALKAVNLFVVEDGRDVAHAAFYCDDQCSKIAYLSSIGVLPEFHGSGVAGNLLVKVFDRCLAEEMKLINLEVDFANLKAVKFYEKYGFRFISDKVMQKNILDYQFSRKV